MKRVAIIGVGLIGGSLGLALKKRPGSRRRYEIIGAGRHEHKLRIAMKMGAIDAFTTDFSKAAMESDIIVICVPVQKIAVMVRDVARQAKPGAIITDAGSVKAQIVKESHRALKAAGRKNVYFVGGHPLAGSEKTGVVNGDAKLYKDATVVLTPVRGLTNFRALTVVRNMWLSAGARVALMSPEKHDETVASTSHLPHVLSSALVNVVAERNRKDPQAKKLLAGSFRDMTRISDSDPENWAGICGRNSKNVIIAINVFKKELERAARAIRKSETDGAVLKKYFERAKEQRWHLLQSNREKK